MFLLIKKNTKNWPFASKKRPENTLLLLTHKNPQIRPFRLQKSSKFRPFSLRKKANNNGKLASKVPTKKSHENWLTRFCFCFPLLSLHYRRSFSIRPHKLNDLSQGIWSLICFVGIFRLGFGVLLYFLGWNVAFSFFLRVLL